MEYEVRVARIGEDMCHRLGIFFVVSGVIWAQRTILSRMNSDECLFIRGRLILPKQLEGKLEPDDWMPLMASSLIYRKRLVWTMPTDAALTLLLSPVVLILGEAVVVRLFSINLIAILLYLALVVVPFVAYGFSRARKKLRLQADYEAARLLGTEVCVGVLQKIDALRLDDVEKTKRRGLSRYFSSKPNLAERISHLGSI